MATDVEGVSPTPPESNAKAASDLEVVSDKAREIHPELSIPGQHYLDDYRKGTITFAEFRRRNVKIATAMTTIQYEEEESFRNQKQERFAELKAGALATPLEAVDILEDSISRGFFSAFKIGSIVYDLKLLLRWAPVLVVYKMEHHWSQPMVEQDVRRVARV